MKYLLTYTAYIEVEADNEDDAMEQGDKMATDPANWNLEIEEIS